MIEENNAPIQCQAAGGHKLNILPDTIARVRRLDGGLLEVMLLGPVFVSEENPALLALMEAGAATAALSAPGGLPTDGNPPPGDPPPEA